MRSLLVSQRLVARLQSPKSNSHARWNSTQPPSSSDAKPLSPHVGFYKVFTRPVAKVLLMATFTYQLAYWGWVYLEKEEMKRVKTGEIETLETQLEKLTKTRTRSP